MGIPYIFQENRSHQRKKGGTNFKCLKQVCIIPFRRDFLLRFNGIKQTPLEIIESVDMLRISENEYKVKMVYSHYDTYSVDTSRELELVERKMRDDKLTGEYV